MKRSLVYIMLPPVPEIAAPLGDGVSEIVSRRGFCLALPGSFTLETPLRRATQTTSPTKPERIPSLTDLDGILVGHYTCKERPTGCTVITSKAPFVAGVDIRGGAPGAYDTELLRPEKIVDRINAVFLSGGSAFGLAVGPGVARWLEKQGLGFEVGTLRVPIVCGAILFDLGLGDGRVRPDAKAGYEACKTATSAPVREGNVGAGAGATIGKYLGTQRAMKGGLGSWALRRQDALQVGAVVAVNAMGNIVDPSTGKIIAGARNDDSTGFLDNAARIRTGQPPAAPVPPGTVIGVVATNALLSKTQCNTVARMAQDALARCICPAHLPWDGDTVFAMATGKFTGGGQAVDVGLVGVLAADVLAAAILRAIKQAESWGPYPAYRDYPSRH
jgi:L-aminopeptidase/D-esterase-like protein